LAHKELPNTEQILDPKELSSTGHFGPHVALLRDILFRKEFTNMGHFVSIIDDYYGTF
jgi:hypothetical protein